MKPFVWKEGMTAEETKDGAYWERNMLALFFAIALNDISGIIGAKQKSGWYYHGEWAGWTRVISIDDGTITFHVPDDFDMGKLQQIEPNWDGHTTEDKWNYIMGECGVNPIEVVH